MIDPEPMKPNSVLPLSTKDSEDLQAKVSAIFLNHHSYVRYLALLNAPELSVVDDIVNDTFIEFSKGYERWDLSRDLKPLLRTIVKRTARHHWQAHLRLLPAYQRELAEQIAEELQTQDREDLFSNLDDQLMTLKLCIKKLSPRSRQILDLHYFKGNTFAKIATRLEMNLNTLYYQISRIRHLLRTCVENTLKSEVADV